MKPQQYEAHIYKSMPPDGKSQLQIIMGCYAIVRYIKPFTKNIVKHCLGCHEEPTDDFLESKNSQALLLNVAEDIYIQGACCMVIDVLEREGAINRQWDRMNE